MSAWLKAVRPALKLIKVFTTATDASEMAVAAGMPSSRTRPEDWRVNSPEPVAARPPLIGALVLAIFPLLNRANVPVAEAIGRFQNHRSRPRLRQERFIAVGDLASLNPAPLDVG